MRVLLTWTDRGPRSVRSSVRNRGAGPVKTAVMRAKEPYEHVVLLSTREVMSGARELMSELREYGVSVLVQEISGDASERYEGLYEAMWRILKTLSDDQVDGLISAGSPKARAAWLALAASGLFGGRLIQVQGDTIHSVELPGIRPQDASTVAVKTLREAVEETERQAIQAALVHTGRNLSQTARVLEIDRNTLKRKMRQMGLNK